MEEEKMEEEPKTIEQLEEEKKMREQFFQCYENILDRLKFYCDLDEKNYLLDSLWCLGTYFHQNFPTYPYLFINAMKGSGKTRLLKLISFLSKNGNGELLNSLTEAVLFREKGILCIDEFEAVVKGEGKTNLRELLNTAYKQGSTVKREKRIKTSQGEEWKTEKFDVYRPIAMANIWGMEEVLGDRCITQILEKSERKDIINLMEIFAFDEVLQTTLITLNTLNTLTTSKNPGWCSLCNVVMLRRIYMAWNYYTKYHNYNTTLTTITTETTQTTQREKLEKFIKKISESKIDGRNLELAFPLFLIAFELDNITEELLLERENSILDEIINTIKDIFHQKKSDEFIESKDVSIIDFLSQEPETEYNKWIRVSELTGKFKEFIQSNDEWINAKWMGRRLKTLKLIKESKRMAGGVYVIPNYQYAQEKIKMFK